ncbi:hypothetical protein PCYB_143110 [Plasmodium cynomolgi strain B]|uniref:V-type proton ATPase subunit S1/VOA1 transmembrane domain-containing protein n=1 Tax=Plasmodium cynomolgi (strain B) TaxID=1120755 RepID=K6UMT5_PLACD|nr:hypothetical protein PCYB_143110 [Plasmodium cynomolgi strain B]GAB68883.1 hypothetical protein PCYB_143110 [Plasmodium cynomolgi strain B]
MMRDILNALHYSNEVIQSFDKETVLNLSDKVFNIFLDTKTKNADITTTYPNIYNKSKVTIDGTCAYVKDLIRGRNLKYLDELETLEYTKSKNANNFSIYVYTSILSQLIVIFLIFFFLFIGFYVLMNISTPKIFEDKQLIINKEH